MDFKPHKFIVDRFIVFSVSDWLEKPEYIVHLIEAQFLEKVIIRSSAVGEDSSEQSLAGMFHSEPNVNPGSRQSVVNGIERVIGSYHTHQIGSPELNEVIVQEQLTDVMFAGVVFSYEIQNGAPYYSIHYQASNTNAITSGVSDQYLYVPRGKWNLAGFPFDKLVGCVREIEQIFKSKCLDIEFGIDNESNIHIFQVRPITSDTQIFDVKEQQIFYATLADIHFQTTRLFKANTYTVLSDMTDWNPAEILGSRAKPLATSLYRKLITDNTWATGRASLNYHDVSSVPLMHVVGSKGYIDVRASLMSLVPKSVPESVQAQMVGSQLRMLQHNPDFIDKVEFEISLSCVDITGSRLKKLKAYGLADTHIRTIKDALIQHTDYILQSYVSILEEDASRCQQLLEKRDMFLAEKSASLTIVSEMVECCRELGAFSFVRVARLAFIACDMLAQLEQLDCISSTDKKRIFETTNTPASRMRKDLSAHALNKLEYNTLCERYGHLRPSTYEITSSRYDQGLLRQLADSVTPKNNAHFKDEGRRWNHTSPDIEYGKIQDMLRSAGINHYDPQDFIDFAISAISAREDIKLAFTTLLSDLLEEIADWGGEVDLLRNDLSFIEIDQLLSLTVSPSHTLSSLHNSIEKAKKVYRAQSYVKMPALITTPVDVTFPKSTVSSPNFVTEKCVEANTQRGDSQFVPTLADCKGKIVIIESADPGYEWLFSSNIAALVTKYGGVASHMAIRCNELGIPATIGCGTVLFEKIASAQRLQIDCFNKKITVIH